MYPSPGSENEQVVPPVDPSVEANTAPEVENPVEEKPDVLSEEIKKGLKDLLIFARDEDRFVRDRQLMLWKRLEYYWNNVLDIFLDPVSRDWRVPDWDDLEASGELPPRLINI